MKQLADYLQYMQAEDVLAATEKAKAEARTLLEDQGIAVIALLLADVLADAVQQGMPKAANTASARSSTPS